MAYRKFYLPLLITCLLFFCVVPMFAQTKEDILRLHYDNARKIQSIEVTGTWATEKMEQVLTNEEFQEEVEEASKRHEHLGPSFDKGMMEELVRMNNGWRKSVSEVSIKWDGTYYSCRRVPLEHKRRVLNSDVVEDYGNRVLIPQFFQGPSFSYDYMPGNPPNEEQTEPGSLSVSPEFAFDWGIMHMAIIGGSDIRRGQIDFEGFLDYCDRYQYEISDGDPEHVVLRSSLHYKGFTWPDRDEYTLLPQYGYQVGEFVTYREHSETGERILKSKTSYDNYQLIGGAWFPLTMEKTDFRQVEKYGNRTVEPREIETIQITDINVNTNIPLEDFEFIVPENTSVDTSLVTGEERIYMELPFSLSWLKAEKLIDTYGAQVFADELFCNRPGSYEELVSRLQTNPKN